MLIGKTSSGKLFEISFGPDFIGNFIEYAERHFAKEDWLEVLAMATALMVFLDGENKADSYEYYKISKLEREIDEYCRQTKWFIDLAKIYGIVTVQDLIDCGQKLLSAQFKF